MVSNKPLVSSSVSVEIATTGAKTSSHALPQEILYNLCHQHNWSDLQLHEVSTNSALSTIRALPTAVAQSQTAMGNIVLISGIPPRHSYIHPDFLGHLIQNNLEETDIEIQREWVAPMNTGEKWSLKKFCALFDTLPKRKALQGASNFMHQDAKRILCGMKAHDGFGGDGTIVYYIMQEGEVKPRQN